MKVMPNRKAIRPAQRGFSLVEVLIALIVMSVGMLGIAGLYVHSMQAGRTSLFRHQAVNLAGDIADRIRANPTAGAAYTAANGVNHNCVAGVVDCTPVEMAENDILVWDAQAADTLPGAAVGIVFNNGVTPNEYQIQVTWTEAGQAQAYAFTIPVLPF